MSEVLHIKKRISVAVPLSQWENFQGNSKVCQICVQGTNIAGPPFKTQSWLDCQRRKGSMVRWCVWAIAMVNTVLLEKDRGTNQTPTGWAQHNPGWSGSHNQLRPLSYISSEDLEQPLTFTSLNWTMYFQSTWPSSTFTWLCWWRVYVGMYFKPTKEWSQAFEWYAQPLLEQMDRPISYHIEGCMYTSQAHDPSPQIMAGDVVIVHDEDLPCSSWKLGRAEKVLAGRDGQIRAAMVWLSTGQGTLLWPIQLHYQLEVHDEDDQAGTQGRFGRFEQTPAQLGVPSWIATQSLYTCSATVVLPSLELMRDFIAASLVHRSAGVLSERG